jgi:hypothetical protein
LRTHANAHAQVSVSRTASAFGFFAQHDMVRELLRGRGAP